MNKPALVVTEVQKIRRITTIGLLDWTNSFLK